MSSKIPLRVLTALCVPFVCVPLVISSAGAGRTVLPPGAGEQPGAVLDLGTLGGRSAAAHDVNTWGVVAGESTTSDDLRQAFLTMPAHVMVALRPYDAVDSRAFSINDRGDVVGYAFGDGIPEASEGFRQTGRLVRAVGDCGPSSVGCFQSPLSINNLREAVGWRYPPYPSIAPVAVAWRQDGVSRLLSPTGKRGEALDINDRGQIVGWSADPTGVTHAVVWGPDGAVLDLGMAGGIASVAVAINELGDVAGYRYTADLKAHACLWRRNGGVVDVLPDVESVAYDVNDAGQVVGVLVESESSEWSTPFVWSAESGLVRLTNLIGGPSTARKINALGEIVGWVAEPIEEGPSHAMWWYEPPSMSMEFRAIRQLIAVLAADHVIGHGHAVAATAHARAAERAWAAGDGPRAARHTRTLSAWLLRVARDERRAIHLAAFLERLSLRLQPA